MLFAALGLAFIICWWDYRKGDRSRKLWYSSSLSIFCLFLRISLKEKNAFNSFTINPLVNLGFSLAFSINPFSMSFRTVSAEYLILYCSPIVAFGSFQFVTQQTFTAYPWVCLLVVGIFSILTFIAVWLRDDYLPLYKTFYACMISLAGLYPISIYFLDHKTIGIFLALIVLLISAVIGILGTRKIYAKLNDQIP